MFHRCCIRVQQARDFKATFPFVRDNDRTAFDADNTFVRWLHPDLQVAVFNHIEVSRVRSGFGDGDASSGIGHGRRHLGTG